MKPDMSIIIPAYREETRLPPTLRNLQEYIKKSNLTYEIIIVVEPSPDQTLKVAKEWEMKMEEVIVIENPKRLGKGGSVRQGMIRAKAEVVAFMDADGATSLNFFTAGYERVKKDLNKVVIASRGLKDSVIVSKQSLGRQRLGGVFRWLTKIVMGLPFQDTQCGAKIFHSTTLPYLFEPLKEFGFAFDVEILLRAKLAHIPVLEMGCTWEDKEGSTVNPIKDGWSMFKTLCKLKIDFWKYRKEAVVWNSQSINI